MTSVKSLATTRTAVVAAALCGVVAGYVTWLTAGMVIITTTPVQTWPMAGAATLVAISGFALFFGRRSSTRPLRQFLWWSPLGPALASAWLLVSILVS